MSVFYFELNNSFVLYLFEPNFEEMLAFIKNL